MTTRFRKYGPPGVKAPMTGPDVPWKFYDLTTNAGVTASGILCTRSGATVYAQQGASLVVPLGNNVPIFEDYGTDDPTDPAAGGGILPLDTYTPSFVSFDFSGGGGWTLDASMTNAANAANAPDGTLTADLVTDTQAGSRQAIYRTAATVAAFSVWCMNDPGNVPTGDGALAADNTPTVLTPLGSRSTWRRVWLEAAAPTNFTVLPAGGADQTKTGGVYLWGAQFVSAGNNDRRFKLPLLASAAASGICTYQPPASDLSAFVSAGALDMGVAWRPLGDQINYSAGLQTIYLFYALIDGKEWSVRWIYNDTVNLRVWTLRAAGVDVQTTNLTGNISENNQSPYGAAWRGGDELYIRFYAGSDKTAIQVRHNASVQPIRFGPGIRSPIAPTAVYLGSNATTANNCLKGRITRVDFYNSHRDWDTAPPFNGVICGDSTVGTDLGTNASLDRACVASMVATITQARAGYRIFNQAKPGDTVAGQLNKWFVNPRRGDPTLKWVYILGPVNDIANGSSGTATTSALQTWITDIATQNPTVKIYVAQPVPCDNWTSMNAAKQAEWIVYAKNIAGTGANPITGATWIDTASSNTLNNNGSISNTAGNNFLKALYNKAVAFGGGAAGSGDGVHENNAGRAVFAAALLARLIVDGLQP